MTQGEDDRVHGPYLDEAIALCRGGGFRRITIRGDTKFTQTKHLDRWDAEGIRFLFGMDAREDLKDLTRQSDDSVASSALSTTPRLADLT
ncbi:MAG TPA: hypothetical protein VHZ02_12305 [Acidimicrobiales bacterium]|nr:hypothetical protein [Acidimicrobiales bacterium]